MVTAREVVRRWGGRAVGLTVAAIGLYVVAPGLLAVFGAWPRLSEVQPRWFVILVLLESRELRHPVVADPARARAAPGRRRRRGRGGRPSGAAGLGHGGDRAAGRERGQQGGPGGAATGGVVQAKLLIQAGQPAGRGGHRHWPGSA